MYIGIDLGGTNIAIGLVDDSGNIIEKSSTPTLASRSFEEIVKDMVTVSEKIVKAAGYSMDDVKGVGIGCPSAVDNNTGDVVYTANIASFRNVPLAKEFQKYYDIPVTLENDANAAAFGEYAVNGDNASVFIAVTLGTGIGGGIIIDNKIFRGSNGAGTEIGHIPLVHNGLRCNCGRKGCWEVYASVTALINQTKVAIAKHPESLMKKIADERGTVNGRTAFDAEKKGDAIAHSVVDKYIEYVADGLVGIINIFQPEKLVISGVISKEGEYLIKPIIDYVRKYDFNQFFEPVKIEPAKLLNDAGIIGAAMLGKSYESVNILKNVFGNK